MWNWGVDTSSVTDRLVTLIRVELAFSGDYSTYGRFSFIITGHAQQQRAIAL